MTPRAKLLLVIFGLLVVLWQGMTLSRIQAELKAIRDGLQLPRASYPHEDTDPRQPAAARVREVWRI